MSRLRELWRTPLVHFVLLGAALFAVVQASHPSARSFEARELVVSTRDVAGLYRDWVNERGSEPTRTELDAAIDGFVDDALLFREARKLGLERSDAGVRTRLVQVARFVSEDSSRSEAQLYELALDLGMVETDLVVRRQLIAAMRLVARQVPREGENPITEQALLRYIAQYPDEYRLPSRVTFSHVYFSRDRRGEGAENDARALAAAVREAPERRSAVDAEGDPFLAGDHFRTVTESKVAALFGTTFAESLARAPMGTWTGPLESSFGFHLVHVSERTAPEPAKFEAIRKKALLSLAKTRQEERLQVRLDEWREQTPIRIEFPDVELDVAETVATVREP